MTRSSRTSGTVLDTSQGVSISSGELGSDVGRTELAPTAVALGVGQLDRHQVHHLRDPLSA